MDAKQINSSFALAIVAIVPFALACCSRASSVASSGDAAIVTDAGGSTSAPNADPSATMTTATQTAEAAQDVQLSVAAERKRKCEQARRTMGAIIATSRRCSTDADCTQIYTSCGLPGICGISINKINEAKIKGQQKLWDDATCTTLTASPCPTCPMPPPPRCVEGECN